MNNDKYNEISRFAAADKRYQEAVDRGDVAAAMVAAAQMEEAASALAKEQGPASPAPSCVLPPSPTAELEELAAQLREEIRQTRQEAKEDNQQTRQETEAAKSVSEKRFRWQCTFSIISIILALASFIISTLK